MSLEVRRVDVFDDGALADWYAALQDGATTGRRHPIVTTLSAFRASVRDPHPHRVREPWAACDDGRVVGALLLELSHRENTHLAEVEIDVPPAERRRGVGAALWRTAERRIVEEGRTTVLTELNVPTDVADHDHPGWRFGAARGFASVNVEQRLLLDLPVDPDRYVEHAVAAATAYELLGWLGATPAEHLEAVAELNTAMSRDVPVGEADVEPTTFTAEDIARGDARLAAQGWESLLALARERTSGTLVAYSQLLVNREQPADALQDDTLVLREHRGHRLGTVLKAANLRRLQAEYPAVERVQTWTAEQNAPMLHVNAAFGFQPVERMHEFQLKC